MTNNQIGILGWLARPAIAIKCIQAGYTINGSTTSKNKLSTLKKHNIKSFLIDIPEKMNH